MQRADTQRLAHPFPLLTPLRPIEITEECHDELEKNRNCTTRSKQILPLRRAWQHRFPKGEKKKGHPSRIQYLARNHQGIEGHPAGSALSAFLSQQALGSGQSQQGSHEGWPTSAEIYT